MRWENQRQSDNVEDRRGGGSRGSGLGGRSLGLGSIVIALLASWIFGINPMTVLGLLDGAVPPHGQDLRQADAGALQWPHADRLRRW